MTNRARQQRVRGQLVRVNTSTSTSTYTSQSYYSIYGIVYTVDQVHSTAPGGSATGRITCTVSYKLFTV